MLKKDIKKKLKMEGRFTAIKIHAYKETLEQLDMEASGYKFVAKKKKRKQNKGKSS